MHLLVGRLVFLCLESLTLLSYLFKQVLVHVEEVAGEERDNEGALRGGKVYLPDPAFHWLMMRHCDHCEVKLAQAAEEFGPLGYNSLLSRRDFECLKVFHLIDGQDLFYYKSGSQTELWQFFILLIRPDLI